MKLVLDGKSLVVGLIAGVALAVGLGAVQPEEPQVGRFQVAAAASPGGATSGYAIDSATGKIWREGINGGFADEKLGNEK